LLLRAAIASLSTSLIDGMLLRQGLNVDRCVYIPICLVVAVRARVPAVT